MDVICFDLDSTLVDSVRVHSKSFNRALKKLGYKTKKQEEYFRLLGMPKEKLVKKLVPKANKKIIMEIIKLHDKYLVDNDYKYARKLKYSLGILKFLKKKRYKIVIVSNCKHRNIRAILKGAGISREYFGVLIGNDDVRHSKPYPDEILRAKKRFKDVKFMIGDSKYDIIAGKKARVKTIGVTTGHYKAKELKKYKPDYIIKDLRGLKRVL